MASPLNTQKSTISSERSFFVQTLRGVCGSAPGVVWSAQDQGHPPPDARVTHSFRMMTVLKGTHHQLSDFGSGPETFPMRQGDVFLMRPGTWRLPLPGGERRLLVVHFHSSYLTCTHYVFSRHKGGLIFTQRNFSTASLLPAAGIHLLRAVEELSKTHPFPDAGQPAIRALLHQVKERVEYEPKAKSKSEMTYLALCTYLQENFRAQVSRQSAADHLHIHPAHVSRLFRRFGETGFQETLQGIRMEYAVKLLADPRLTIKEIAGSCGFQSPDYFREAFRREFGKSPQAYRVRLRMNEPVDDGC